MSGSPTLDRALGCLLGLAVGDAVGTTLEFAPRDAGPPLTDMVGGGPFGLEPGVWTDDTSMALCLADSLLEQGGLDERDLARRFLRWWRQGYNSPTGACFDIGNTVRAALARYEATADPIAGSDDPSSAGNGSIMRLAPVAILWHADPAAAEDAARRQSRVTHGAPAAVEACALLARLLVEAIGGAPRERVLAPRAWPPGPAEIDAVARGSFRGRDRATIRSGGYVVDTLEAALWAVDRAGDFREAVLLAANLGDDADTVAAVTGQLAGAIFGASAIPRAWLDELAWRERIEERGRALFAARRSS